MTTRNNQTVQINGQAIQLNAVDQLGVGGEGTVFRVSLNGTQYAAKVYHKPDAQRAKKLQAFMAKTWTLPLDRVMLPLELIKDSKGKTIVGLTMPYLDGAFDVIGELASKKFRAANQITTSRVAKILLDGGYTLTKIHQNGLVIGDFNDRNVLFRGDRMNFIDVDSWQFDTFACPVVTEQFADPAIYGIDLSSRPVFVPNHDWYAYAVMVFKSLLLTHPYGGVHGKLPTLPKRASNKIPVWNSAVKYPAMALSIDLLDDDLMHAFDEVFAQGKRGPFPLQKIENYLQSLVPCPKCGIHYPRSRHICPACSEKTLVAVVLPTTVNKDVTITIFLRTQGPIVYSRLSGTTLRVIAYENGLTVLYTKRGNSPAVRQELFTQSPGARFEIFGETLVVNRSHTTELLFLDVSGSTATPLFQSEAAIFAGNRRAMFRTNNRYLFRIVSGSLMYGELKYGKLVEKHLRGIMDQQTWFAVDRESIAEKPTVFGFFQMLQRQIFWLVWEGRHYENLKLSSMADTETLIDISVKFSSQGMLVRRLTEDQGVNYLRTDQLAADGTIVVSLPRVKQEDHHVPQIHGQAYSTGVLLHATDDGIVQERVESQAIRIFEATKGQVHEGDALFTYPDRSLLVVSDDTVKHLKMG